MAVNIVTGIGPRVGSSFVMQQCKAKGLYVNGTKFLNGLLPKAGNPKGYYDIFPWEVSNIKRGIAKVWPVALTQLQVPVNKIIILKRKSFQDQLESCIKQAKREPIKTEFTCEEIIHMAKDYLDSWLSVNDSVDHRSYYTEDLNSSIDSIVEFLGD